MITKDGSIVRVAPIVDTSAIRQAVLDEDGHIRELPAEEWRNFSGMRCGVYARVSGLCAADYGIARWTS